MYAATHTARSRMSFKKCTCQVHTTAVIHTMHAVMHTTHVIAAHRKMCSRVQFHTPRILRPHSVHLLMLSCPKPRCRLLPQAGVYKPRGTPHSDGEGSEVKTLSPRGRANCARACGAMHGGRGAPLSATADRLPRRDTRRRAWPRPRSTPHSDGDRSEAKTLSPHGRAAGVQHTTFRSPPLLR